MITAAAAPPGARDGTGAAVTATLGGTVRALDGLRGLAIAGVLACHLLNAWPGTTPLDRGLVAALGLGWAGVDLFFVLSGFLITGILVDTLGPGDGPAPPGWWRGFLVRRALRIFPLYYLALGLFGAFGPALGLVDPWTFGRWGFWYWSYLGNWAFPAEQVIPALSHFWSLAVEEQFYLAWPAVVLAARGRRLAWTCAALLVAGPALRWLVVESGWVVGSAFRVTPGRVDALAMGGLVAVGLRDAALRGAVVRLAAPAAALGAVGFAALGLPHGFDMHTRPLELWSHTLLALAFAGLLARAVASEAAGGRLAALLAARPLAWLGRYSYGLYVWHYLVHVGLLGALRRTAWGAEAIATRAGYAGHVAAATAASVVLALASFHLLERRFLAWKDRLAPRAAPVAPRAPGNRTAPGGFAGA